MSRHLYVESLPELPRMGNEKHTREFSGIRNMSQFPLPKYIIHIKLISNVLMSY